MRRSYGRKQTAHCSRCYGKFRTFVKNGEDLPRRGLRCPNCRALTARSVIFDRDAGRGRVPPNLRERYGLTRDGRPRGGDNVQIYAQTRGRSCAHPALP